MGTRKIKKQNQKPAPKKGLDKGSIIMIVIAAVLVVAMIILLVIALGSDKKNNGPMLSGKHYVEMEITDYGVIQLELDADVAPITVTHFIDLVNDGFYDGLTFHRIIEGFMMQGGDPTGTGRGQTGQPTITGEFSANGVKNDISHERGVISMARRGDSYDSATSQFFIMHKDDTRLDGEYAAFGHVISGMEVVDKICESVPVTDGNGSVSAKNQPVIKYIKVIEKPQE